MPSTRRAWGPGKRGGGKVRGEITDGAVVVTRSVKLEPGVTELGEAVQDDSDGTPAQARATDWLNPAIPFTINL
jgi:hypothetical protein